jgi:hypothetical protein
VTTAVLWEFAEYVTFVPGSPEAATAYADTLLDIALGMVGGGIAAIVVGRHRSRIREERVRMQARRSDVEASM